MADSRNLTGVLLIVALLGGAAWQLPRLLDVPVRSILIEGDLNDAERTAVRDAISAALMIDDAAIGLHSLSLDTVRDAITDLTWADAVGVRRRWPDTLQVHLRRQAVAARWGGGGYVAGNGRIIEPATEVVGDLPLLDCSLSSAPRGMEVFQLLTTMLAPVALRPRSLHESRLGEWSVGLDNGVTVVLGRQDLQERLQRFMAVYAALSDRAARIGTVDARYHNGVAVAWRDAVSAALAQRTE